MARGTTTTSTRNSKPVVDEPVGVDEGDDIPSVITYSEDIDDAEAPNPLPRGTYPAEIIGVVVKASKSTPGSRYYEVSLLISKDAYPADFEDGPDDGVTLYYRRLSANDNKVARYRLKLFGEIVGVRIGREVDPNVFTGKEVRVIVDNEPAIDGSGMVFATASKLLSA